METLRYLFKTAPKDRKAVLETKPVVDGVCECIGNLIKGTVPLSKSQIKTLRTRAPLLRKLGTSKTPWKTRRRLLQQQGKGFIPNLVRFFKNYEIRQKDETGARRPTHRPHGQTLRTPPRQRSSQTNPLRRQSGHGKRFEKRRFA